MGSAPLPHPYGKGSHWTGELISQAVIISSGITTTAVATGPILVGDAEYHTLFLASSGGGATPNLTVEYVVSPHGRAWYGDPTTNARFALLTNQLFPASTSALAKQFSPPPCQWAVFKVIAKGMSSATVSLGLFKQG